MLDDCLLLCQTVAFFCARLLLSFVPDCSYICSLSDDSFLNLTVAALFPPHLFDLPSPALHTPTPWAALKHYILPSNKYSVDSTKYILPPTKYVLRSFRF